MVPRCYRCTVSRFPICLFYPICPLFLSFFFFHSDTLHAALPFNEDESLESDTRSVIARRLYNCTSARYATFIIEIINEPPCRYEFNFADQRNNAKGN